MKLCNCLPRVVILYTSIFVIFLLMALPPHRSIFAQGNLTPPGPPGPGMKTLKQIEPRTPIEASGTFTISQSGSYYLTGNVTVDSGDAATITADNVSLDLNGFIIQSTDPFASGTGIVLSGDLMNVTISNGFIAGSVTQNAGVFSGGGFINGISSLSNGSYNLRVIGVSISGCMNDGILLSLNSVVESCSVNAVGGYGISAQTVSNSNAWNCGNTAIYAVNAVNCYGKSVGSGDGLHASTAINSSGHSAGNGYGLSANVANNCFGFSPGAASGLHAESATNCYGSSAGGGYGVDVKIASHCYGSSRTGSGIRATSADNCYGSTFNGLYGIIVKSALNCYGSGSGTATGINADLAIGCYATATNGIGLSARNAINCYAASTGNIGLSAVAVNNSYGQSGGVNAQGIQATVVNNSYGIGTFGNGIEAEVAQNSAGSSSNTSVSQGLYAKAALNCYGQSPGGAGLSAVTAQNCYGSHTGSFTTAAGLYAQSIAIGCYGTSVTGVGLDAFIANSCRGSSLNVTNKYNMP